MYPASENLTKMSHRVIVTPTVSNYVFHGVHMGELPNLSTIGIVLNTQ